MLKMNVLRNQTHRTENPHLQTQRLPVYFQIFKHIDWNLIDWNAFDSRMESYSNPGRCDTIQARGSK